MSVGAAFAERVMRNATGAGCYTSFHSVNPGDAGVGMIGSFYLIPSGVFQTTGHRTINAQSIRIPSASASGTATYFGLWTLQQEWIIGGRLRSAERIVAGQSIEILSGELLVVF